MSPDETDWKARVIAAEAELARQAVEIAGTRADAWAERTARIAAEAELARLRQIDKGYAAGYAAAREQAYENGMNLAAKLGTKPDAFIALEEYIELVRSMEPADE